MKCKDCKHFKLVTVEAYGKDFSNYFCRHPKKYSPHLEEICNGYQRKWWKVWVR